ncbi:hypothetical protein ACFOY2_15890 [Nonomuraea purpurea]|uniref:Uncharacterized protein n=1 Tax=Nonomuraea purpurea TaxID=1849276 RepID=A0ABV8G4R7_9ACTN
MGASTSCSACCPSWLKPPPGGTMVLFTGSLVEDRGISDKARRLAETVEDDLEEFAERMLGAFGVREDDVVRRVFQRSAW